MKPPTNSTRSHFRDWPDIFIRISKAGIKNIQMIMEKGSEKELPNNGYYIESQKSSFVYWFDNGSHVSFDVAFFHRSLLTLPVNRKWNVKGPFRCGTED